MRKLEVSPTMISTFILGLVAIMLLSAGQTSLKFGLNAIDGVSLADGLASILKLFQTPWIFVGFACYGLSSIADRNLLFRGAAAEVGVVPFRIKGLRPSLFATRRGPVS